MRPRHLVLLFRLALLIAVAASAVLVVDYRNAGDPAFCGVTSGCFAVRMSKYSSLFGLPLPNIGLMAFGGLLALTLTTRSASTYALAGAAAALGGLGGGAMLAVQHYVIKAFCPWCVAVDAAAILAAILGVFVALTARSDPAAFELDMRREARSVTTAWTVTTVAALGLPFVWGMFPTLAPLPPGIAALQVPGKITIVGFTDFECPYCRLMHPELARIEERHGDRIHYIRKMKPLESHRGAVPAAKAYLCTPEPLRPAAATLLYAAPPEDLTTAGVVQLLTDEGALELDASEVSACMRSPATQAALDADVALYDGLQAKGLPFTYVGRRVVLGANAARIDDAIRQEAAGDALALPPGALFALLGAITMITVAASIANRGKVDDDEDGGKDRP
ncbi:MAG: thioredoxin domain-containing protein [Polyangiaceae bacterium]|nr:thioredoxin domain-containing protein [Polyangiaceae bacterium]